MTDEELEVAKYDAALLDHFAGKAMQGFLMMQKGGYLDYGNIATGSYLMAEAMIKERHKTKQERALSALAFEAMRTAPSKR